MENRNHKLRLTAIVMLGLFNIGVGFFAGALPMLASGAAGLAYAGSATNRLCYPQTAELTRPQTDHE
jgi:hypothetical protein